MCRTVPSEQEGSEEQAVLVLVGCVMAAYGQASVDLICLPETNQKTTSCHRSIFHGGLRHSFSDFLVYYVRGAVA